MAERTPDGLREVLDRAIALCSRYVPVEHRALFPGGGNVFSTATAILVAGRALVEALIEHDDKPAEPK